MKNVFIYLIIFSTVISINTANAQSNIKTWTQATVQDFSQNQLIDLLVTNASGGEVQFPRPLQKIVQDYKDNSAPMFTAKDSSGNYIRTWVEGGNVYVKKYSTEGREITKNIRVNEVDGIAGQDGKSRVATFNDGTYLVVWADIGYNPKGNDYNIYGQILKNDSVKVGNNFKINHVPNISARIPTILANKFDQTFWIFYSLNIPNIYDRYKIYVQKRDKNGNNLSDTLYLNQSSITTTEGSPSVAQNEKGFSVAWWGANSNSSLYCDIYFRNFNSNGTPLGDIIKVNDDTLNHCQLNPSLCFDNKSNLLIVWGDQRDQDTTSFTVVFNIYGQMYDSSGTKISNNIRLQDSSYTGMQPFIEFTQNEFQLTWTSYNGYGGYNTFVNRWKFHPIYYGEMISKIFDAGPSNNMLGKIYWRQSLSQGTGIKFKIRTGNTPDQLANSNWFGPAGTSDFYEVDSGEKINPIHNGNRFIQYEAIFNSTNGNTPSLNSVSIEYASSDTIPPLPPADLEAAASHAIIKLSWKPSSSNDLYEYIIYRGIESKQYDKNWKIETASSNTSIEDTSAQTGTKYYYVVSAVDSNHNESTYSNEVSCTSYGINIYVSENGNSGGDGSINNPYKDIGEGLAAAIFGDTVRVLPGTYTKAFIMKDGISLIGTNADECKITTSINTADKCTIKGFTFTQTIVCDHASPIITGNIINLSGGGGRAIWLKGYASPVISKNFITECGSGIGTVNECSAVISNNIIKVNALGIDLGVEDKSRITNNTIIASNISIIRIAWFSTAVIKNNILVGDINNNMQGIFITGNDSIDISFNDISGVKITDIPGKFNFFANPKFVNADLQDYHLLPSSPCKDAGDPNTMFNDLDGSRNDMGAYGGTDPFEDNLANQLTRSISLTSISGYPGDTVSIFLALDNPAGLGKADFDLEFNNSVLTFLNVSLTSTTQHFTLSNQVISEGKIGISISSNTAAASGDKNILELKFMISQNSKPGDASPLTLTKVSLLDSGLKDILIRSITDGTVVVNNFGNSSNHIYVDCKNTGIEEGTRQHPYKTIMHALNKANAGDSILVVSGTYAEPVVMKDSIYLIGSGASVTTITATNNENALTLANIEQAEVSGFTITGDERHYQGMSIIVCESSSPVLKNNFIFGMQGSILEMFVNKNSNLTFENNYIKNIDLNILNSTAVITNNVMEFSDLSKIALSEASTTIISHNKITGSFYVNSSSPVIRNNRIWCTVSNPQAFYVLNSSDGIICNNIITDLSELGLGISITNSNNFLVANNTIITKRKGIEDIISNSNKYFNNIISGNNNTGILISGSSTMDFNDVWNNSSNYGNQVPGIHDISEDPLFINSQKDNFRLSSGSPCINAGNPDAKFNDPDGSRNDIGAYGGPYVDSLWINSNESSLAIDSSTSKLYDTVAVTINGKNIKGIAELKVTLSYDQKLLKMLNAIPGALLKSFSLKKTNLNSSTVNLNLSSSRGVGNEEGELILLYFEVKSDKPVNTILHLDSASIKDETTSLHDNINLYDGNIQIVTTGINDNEDAIPKEFSLYQNYPNPFNPVTKIGFVIPNDSKVTLKVFDILGREVSVLINDYYKAGKYEINFNAGKLASGVYFYQMRAVPSIRKTAGQSITGRDFISTKKLILLK